MSQIHLPGAAGRPDAPRGYRYCSRHTHVIGVATAWHAHCSAYLTRSGKIMRRILRKIAEDDFSNLGDTSTLAEAGVVEDLIANRQNKKASG